MDSKTKIFISSHINDDVNTLALQSKRYSDIDIPLAIRQISGRQKIKNKVPSLYENEEILYPPQLSIEQSSSEISAFYKAGLVSGKSFADLTGGFGIDFIFMAQKFEKKIYVEQNPTLCTLAENNFKVLELSNYQIHNQSAELFIPEMSSVDCIYIDPHRRNAGGQKTMLIEDCEPDVSKMREYFSKSKKVLIKLSPMLDIRRALQSIPETSEIHIVAVENECKEVLLLINNAEKQFDNRNIPVKTINFQKGTRQEFQFLLDDEQSLSANYTSENQLFVFEPNAAIMKSGGFKSIANQFNLKVFHPNTRLYTADQPVINFPGRVFSVLQSYGSNQKEMAEMKKNYPNASVNLRNHPLTVEAFRKKYGIRDGSQIFIFGCRVSDESIRYFVCKKL